MVVGFTTRWALQCKVARASRPLRVDYKRSRTKQCHKQGRALRTETTNNDTRDFGVGRLLRNLSELRRIGLRPTGDCSKSTRSATTAHWARTPSSVCTDLGTYKASAYATEAAVHSWYDHANICVERLDSTATRSI